MRRSAPPRRPKPGLPARHAAEAARESAAPGIAPSEDVPATSARAPALVRRPVLAATHCRSLLQAEWKTVLCLSARDCQTRTFHQSIFPALQPCGLPWLLVSSANSGHNFAARQCIRPALVDRAPRWITVCTCIEARGGPPNSRPRLEIS